MTLSEVGVLFVKRVTINAMSFGCIDRGKTSPAHGILSVVNDFKVSRVDASTYAAQVVALICCYWNGFYKHFIHQAMGALRSLIHLDACVSIAIGAACPQPARASFVGNGRVDFNLLKQTGYASQERVTLDNGVRAVFAFASGRFKALFTFIAKAVTFLPIGVEFGARFFNAALTTFFERGRIGKGHRCLHLGNVT